MARVTVEDCLERVENRFALVHLTARRTRQLKMGAASLSNRNNKEVVLALREIAAGMITFENVEAHEPAPRAEEDLFEEIDDDIV